MLFRSAFAASAADEAIVLVAEKYGTPPLVPLVMPVPPCATVTAAPVVRIVPDASGKVRVRLAERVVGVSVTLYDEVPPARPITSTPSCVDAARVKIPDALVEVIDVNAPVFADVPPIAGGEERSSVPPSVRLPLEVTVPVKVKPLTVPVPDTEVTVPVPPEIGRAHV